MTTGSTRHAAIMVINDCENNEYSVFMCLILMFDSNVVGYSCLAVVYMLGLPVSREPTLMTEDAMASAVSMRDESIIDPTVNVYLELRRGEASSNPQVWPLLSSGVIEL